jgi:hypothetical protein
MKKPPSLFIFCGFCLTNISQVREVSLLIDKTKRPAYRPETDDNTNMLSCALSDKLKSIPLKSGSSKGSVTSMGVKTVKKSPELMDFYTLMKPVGRTRYAILPGLSKRYTHFLTAVGNPEAWENAKSFLINFLPFAKKPKIKGRGLSQSERNQEIREHLQKIRFGVKKQEEALSKAG